MSNFLEWHYPSDEELLEEFDKKKKLISSALSMTYQ